MADGCVLGAVGGEGGVLGWVDCVGGVDVFQGTGGGRGGCGVLVGGLAEGLWVLEGEGEDGYDGEAGEGDGWRRDGVVLSVNETS